MRHWFKDQHFRSLLKNSGYLGASRVVAAIAQLATLSLAAHALGLLLFGILVLIDSYARAVSGIAKFQSWQLIVRYGGRVLLGDEDAFRTSTGFAFALDVVSGLAGMIVGAALLPFIAHWIGLPRDQLTLALLYCLLIPFIGAATPTGVLRALDRFDLISWADTVTPITRMCASALAFLSGAGIVGFLAAWFVTYLIGEAYDIWVATRELRRRGLLKGISPTLRPASLPGAWRFAINVNLNSSIQAAWDPLARLIVGGLLGPAGAALFRVASALSDSAGKPADLLGKAFYPEVMRMDLSSRTPWKLMVRATATAGAGALLAILILVVGGKPAVGFLFGKAFLGAYDALLILMVVPLLTVISFPLPPMLYALDRSDAPLKARLTGLVIYFAAIAPLCWRLGVKGAAIAFVIGNVAMVATMALMLRGEHRRVRRPRPA
jgi:O-antigen/teichoic acid export membrane protein